MSNTEWMKKYCFLFFLFGSISSAFAQNFDQAEYFFDLDPGPGNGTSVLDLNLNQGASFLNVDASGLEPGFHNLYFRVKQNGFWSHYGPKRVFYINSLDASSISSDISAAEYFFNEDPGPGNGIPIPISTGEVLNLNIGVSIDNLDPGFHSFYLRVKQNEIWSHYGPKRIFYIDNATSIEVSSLSKIEVFVDNDPGVGNGSIFDVTEGLTLTEIINYITTDLDEGSHLLYLRVIAANGNVSHYSTRPFSLCGDEVGPALSITELPDCENDHFNVEVNMPVDWEGPDYTITNSLNDQAVALGAGQSWVFGPFISGSNASFTADAPEGESICPVIFDMTFTCYDCQELEVNTFDPCVFDGFPGEYIDCDCELITSPLEITGILQIDSGCEPGIELRLYDPGTTTQVGPTYTTIANESENFSFDEFPTGTYDIIVTYAQYLSVKLEEVTLRRSPNFFDLGELILGDVDASNGINIQDVTAVTGIFNSLIGDEDFNPAADLDCSGGINIQDVTTVTGNFNEVGDEPGDE